MLALPSGLQIEKKAHLMLPLGYDSLLGSNYNSHSPMKLAICGYTEVTYMRNINRGII